MRSVSSSPVACRPGGRPAMASPASKATLECPESQPASPCSGSPQGGKMQQAENPNATTGTGHRGQLRGARSPRPILLSHSVSYYMSHKAAIASAFYIKKKQNSSINHFPSKVKVKVIQSCLTLCDPMDYIVHGIFQARILEWVAFPFSRGSSQPRDQTQVSHVAGGFFTS